MTKVIGLTGGIASGKSTVSNMLRTIGWPIIDADLIAHQIVEPGSRGLSMIVERFGAEILQPDGSLNRRRLGQLVFNDAHALQDLNAIEHPLIIETIDQQLASFKKQQVPVVVLDVPLLFEVGLDQECDLVVVVAVDPSTELKRLMERNHYSKAEAQSRIAAQMPLTEKKRRADVVIDNSGTLEQTRAQVALLVKKAVTPNL